MASMNLIESFSEITDFRKAKGKRYPLGPMFLIVIMSVSCGRCGYREIARFAESNKSCLQRLFNLKRRKKMASHVTFREIIQGVSFEEVNESFEKWAKGYVSIESGDWLAIDGKAIGSTVTNYEKAYQDFVSLVSVFTQKRGQVIKVGKLHNGKSSEIRTVEEIIELLDLKGVVLSMDALHCQKKL